jgi:ribosome modulation factor
MKIRQILEGDVIPLIPRKPHSREAVARFKTLCPECGKPMRGGTDVRTGKRVRICMSCYKTIDEHATLVHPQGGVEQFEDGDKRKRLQKVLKTMKRLGVPRDERLRQVKSHKLFKAIGETSDPQRAAYTQDMKERFARAHSQGVDAFRKGIHRDDNPHQMWLPREAWFMGWDEQARNKAS